MNEDQIRDFVLRLTRPELEELTVRLGINSGFLEHSAPAARAGEIWSLATRPGERGIAGIREALDKMYPARGFGLTGAPLVDHHPPTTCILILAANPLATSKLALKSEANEIRKALAPSEETLFKVIVEPSARLQDLSGLLQQHQPAILHFSGHGTEAGDLQFEDDRGATAGLSLEAFSRIIREQQRPVRCMVLNSCYSASKAAVLAEGVDYVVGMSREIGDTDALAFATGFYRGLATSPNDIARAFRLGCDEVDVRQLPDAMVPRLRTRKEEIARFPIPPTIEAPENTKRFFVKVEDYDLLHRREETGAECTVWYGTNRAALDRRDEGRGYGGDRDSTMHYGKCVVSLPKIHRVGHDRSSLWRRIVKGETAATTLDRISPTTVDGFWEELQKSFQSDVQPVASDLHAFVYIHGFNVTFQEAAVRAAQIGADLKADLVAFFSWPSAGELEKYGYDADSVQFSEDALAAFLQQLSESCHPERLHLLAHSMGNRCVLRSLKSLAARESGKLFGQIFLAAPDVDHMVFQQQGAACPPLSTRTTLYVSRKDRALEGSGFLHQMSRAGLVPPVTILKDIDTVDVTEIDLSLLGHGYFAAARPVLYDLYELINHNTPPQRRMTVLPCKTETQQDFWKIGA